jgi:hypothetical protein
MKRLLYILLFIPLMGLAQKPDFIRTPNSGNTIVDWNLKAKTFILPHGSSVGLYGSQDTSGNAYFKVAAGDTMLYIRVGGTKFWDPKTYLAKFFAPIGSGVTSFNMRTGSVTLSGGDVTTALGFTPVTNTRQIINGYAITGGHSLATDVTIAADSTLLQTITNLFPRGDTRYLQSGYINVTVSSTGKTKAFFPTANTDAARGIALQSAFTFASTGDKINIGAGSYATTTTLALKDSITVDGAGLVYNLNGNTDIFSVKSAAGVTISNIKIKGAGSPGLDTTKQVGIRLNGYSPNFKAINLTITDCRGAGIFENQIWKDSTQYFNGGKILNVNMARNGYGFYGVGEYWTVDGGNHFYNLQAFYAIGGNIKILNTNTSYNFKALRIEGIVGNEGHAIISGNTITHNKKVGLYLKNLTIGEIFASNVFAGAYPATLSDTTIYLENTSGIKFASSIFLAPMHIFLGGAFTGYNYIQNSHFYNYAPGGGNPANVVGTALQKSHLIFTQNTSNDSLSTNLNQEYGNNKTVQTYLGATNQRQWLQFLGQNANVIFGTAGDGTGPALNLGEPAYSGGLSTGRGLGSTSKTALTFGTDQVLSFLIDTLQNVHFKKDLYLESILSAGTNTDGLLSVDATNGKIKKLPNNTFTTNVTASGNIASSGGATPNLTFTGILPSVNGGSGINNSGTLTWGSGGILGTNAYNSTAFYKSGDNASFGTGSFAGLITSTIGNNQNIFFSGTATTGYQFFRIKNTGADLGFGIEGATAVLNAGANPYSTSLTTFNTTHLSFGTNQTLALDIDGGTQAVTAIVSMTTPLVKISTTPATSAGTYDFLTRNTSTGVVEKVSSASIPTVTSTFVTASGTGSATAFTFTYGTLGYTPSNIIYVPTSTAAAGSFYISSITGTGFTVTYLVAPVTGTSNITANITIVK